MKKKGLIISTVVMVVVLIAALTTTTFAWFTQTASVAVDTMEMTTKAAEGLQIGAKANANTDRTGYVYGDDLTFENGYWKNDAGTANGFGNLVGISDEVSFSGIQHASTKYVSSTMGEMAGLRDGKEQLKDGQSLVTASAYDGKDTSNPTPTDYRPAVPNDDYIYLELGIVATSDTIDQIYFTITVEFSGDEAFALKPGMAAAIHFEIESNDGTKDNSKIETEAFKGKTLGANFTGSITEGNEETESTKWTYSGFIYNTNGTAIGLDKICTMKITAWIEGTDDACRTSTAGTGAKITVNFNYKTTTQDELTITSGKIVEE